MRLYDSSQPIIFVHIPKCAGTSFIYLLKQWFREKYRHSYVDEVKGGMLPKLSLKCRNGSWDPNVRCIHAHFDHGRGSGLPYYYPDVSQYVAMIRDPFDIVSSMYFFAKGKNERSEFIDAGKKIDFCSAYPTIEHYINTRPSWRTGQITIAS